MKPIIYILFFLTICLQANAKSTLEPITNKKTKSGLHYKIYQKHKKNRKVVLNDLVLYHLILKTENDSTILDTHKEFGPQQIKVDTSAFKGDLQEALQLLHADDSALFLIKTDSLYGNFMPHFAKPKSFMKFYIKVVKCMTEADFENFLKKEADLQSKKDDSLLKIYFIDYGVKPNKTSTNLYYLVTHEGTGPYAKVGDRVKVNYTGKMIDGLIFDSSTKKEFGHVEPFEFELGKGNVIKGWDEGLLHFNKGAKGFLYIRSGLAYGKRSNGSIPANGIMIFEIELVDIIAQ